MSFDLKMIRGLLVKIIRLENKNPLLREQGMLNEEPKKRRDDNDLTRGCLMLRQLH